MNAIDQNRLLQMRAAIVSQNQALQRAAGLESQAPSSFTQSLSDAVQAVNAQQAKASELSAAYPPSALGLIPQLVERAGNDRCTGGSITALYTVLADGGDLEDPVVDAARAIVDGHRA